MIKKLLNWLRSLKGTEEDWKELLSQHREKLFKLNTQIENASADFFMDNTFETSVLNIGVYLKYLNKNSQPLNKETIKYEVPIALAYHQLLMCIALSPWTIRKKILRLGVYSKDISGEALLCLEAKRLALEKVLQGLEQKRDVLHNLMREYSDGDKCKDFDAYLLSLHDILEESADVFIDYVNLLQEKDGPNKT